jgi:hypothetical protein
LLFGLRPDVPVVGAVGFLQALERLDDLGEVPGRIGRELVAVAAVRTG